MTTDTGSQLQIGMISTQEQEYLYRYASCEYTGQGEIVDLGCWLGSSTIELAKGLQNNPHTADRKVHAYDRFIWEAWMDQYAIGTGLEGKFEPGDSFLQECLDRTSPWQSKIQFYPGDLNRLGWHGGQIDFLFIDAMKNWELANTIIHDFFRALIPGRSVIVHQDFWHYYTYWIHLTMYRLRHYFEPIYDIPYSCSLVYKYVKPIPEDLLKATYALESFTEDEIHAAFDYSSQLVSFSKKPVILAGKVVAFLDLNSPTQIYSALNGFFSINGEISALELQLEQAQAQAELGKQHQQVPAPAYFNDAQLKLKQQLKNARRQTRQLEAELHQSNDRLKAMESSKFWQLRTQWFRLKKMAGLPVNE